MAFPSVTSVTETAHTASTTHTADLPATVADGDLLVLIHTAYAPGAVSTPSGWTQLYQNTFADGISDSIATTFIRDGVSGDGGGTAAMTLTNSEVGCSQVYRIAASSWFGTLAGVEAATAEGSSSTPDPASLTPSWGSADTLWIAVAHLVDDSAIATAAPSSYTDLNTLVGNGAADRQTSVATARRENATATENPGTFTLPQSEAWTGATIGVRPAAASGGGLQLVGGAGLVGSNG